MADISTIKKIVNGTLEKGVDYSLPIHRTKYAQLDTTEVFLNKISAENYAKDVEVGKYQGSVAYPGQSIAVVDEITGEANRYIITGLNNQSTLKRLATSMDGTEIDARNMTLGTLLNTLAQKLDGSIKFE